MGISGVALAAMLAVSASSNRLEDALVKPTGPYYVEHADDNRLGVNVNELMLKLRGGYGRETVDTKSLAVVRALGRTTLYAAKDDRRDLTARHLYADRDGDGLIDTGALYNPRTGLVLADWNCDGTADQVLGDIKP